MKLRPHRSPLALTFFVFLCAACSSGDGPEPGTDTGSATSGRATTGATGSATTSGSGSGAGTGESGATASATTGGATGTDTVGDTATGGSGRTTSSSAVATGGTGTTTTAASSDGGGSSGGGSDGGSSQGGKIDAGADAGGAATEGRDGAVADPEAGGQGEGGTNCAGHALSLSGNSAGSNDAAKQVMHADLGSDLPAGNGNRTIEFWAYVPANEWVGNVNTMYFYGSTTRPSSAERYAHGFGLDFGSAAVNGNHTTLDPFTNGGYDNDNQPSGLAANPPDQWVHFAMTWDGTSVRTFINGVLRITTMSDGSAVGLATDASPIQVGAYEQENAYFNGAFDEFRVWNIARSASDIASTMHTTLKGNEPGLVAYYKFDETSGATAADSVTAANHAPHDGMLLSASGQPKPAFIVSTAPITCP